MLSLQPSEFVIFEKKNVDTMAKVVIKSISKIPVSFKVQTTSPEKFRVRPRCGVLAANESVDVGIWLKQEHELSTEDKDKFLIMGMPTGSDCSNADVADLWRCKPANSPDVEHHRLVCRMADGCQKGGPDTSCGKLSAKSGIKDKDCNDPSGSGVCSKRESVEEQAQRMSKQIKYMAAMQGLTMVVLIVAIVLGVILYLKLPLNGAGAPHSSAIKRPHCK